MIHKLLVRGENRFPLPSFLFIATFFLLLTGCIPTKKIVYVEAEEGGETEHQLQNWEYHIKPGDRFYIKVIDPESGISFSQSTGSVSLQDDKTTNLIQQGPSVHDYLVTENGEIDYPVLGKIPAEGKTIQELITFIEEKSKGYYSNPSVKLFMTNYNVTVLGEVNNPGTYQLITNQPTFFDAVGQARDLTDYANRSRVKIIRKHGSEVSIHYVDVTDPGFIASPYYYVYPDDVIHITPLNVKKFSDNNAIPLFLSVITAIATIISISTR